MHPGSLVFAQLMAYLPRPTFQRTVSRYGGHFKVKSFSCLDQFLVLAFAQLTFRESLRDIEATLRAHASKHYRMGLRGGIARNTLANANAQRDWRIYADFAQHLMAMARQLYAKDSFGVDLKETVYALDSTTIDLCLSLFPWAPFRSTKAAIKLHTLLDLRGNIPSFLHITDGTVHDVNVLDLLIPEAGAFYIMDRAYVDFTRLSVLDEAGAFFVTRAKRNLNYTFQEAADIEDRSQIRSDWRIGLTTFTSRRGYPKSLRRIRYWDPETRQSLTFLTNNFDLPALTICQLYRQRWQVELFFKWIKQHLRIKAFYGTTENAVKTQIWVAVCVYVLVAIVRKRLQVEASMHTILHILSLTLFEITPLDELLRQDSISPPESDDSPQLELF